MYICIIFHKKATIEGGGVRMDKKIKEKIKDVFGKEGFYVALFICLCIIVSVATISYKTYVNNQNKVSNTEETNKEVTLNVDSAEKNNKSNNEMLNAERVQKGEETQKKNENNKTTEKKIVPTASSSTVSFVNPVEGVESRKYTYPTPVKVEEGIFRTIRGVNIESKVGTEVKSAAEGVVELVENSGVEEGMVVQIKHANGIKTRYGNLDPNVQVKQGDKVTANQLIGKIGNTAKVFDKETFGEFLNLQVINSNGEQVNPEKYFTLKSK